ncbi:MBL fold metallo-hydrolase [Mobilitalea sibirica]|uniref:MBL fold metallo-hydrolase n=1 Tax=Mobilitalea sibirica TaxID=1462919 RepID=A0A8J7KRY1_9FIRM|nr:MBL fold metallo-hydrolase [Mobilitalea sibirica]MBH1939756.1 MBL fold metallo-hydrolase [Mobilitalea sibirica]
MKLCSIASGSSGNCIYVGSEQTNLLVDAGISAKRIENGLNGIDIMPDTIQGILITHEHSDHVSGLGILARRYHIPIYATGETIKALKRIKSLGNISEDLYCPVEPNKTFEINDISIEPFATSHDASDPVCYTMQASGYKVGIATDLGMYDDYIVSKLSDSDLLMVEANHDVNMLMVGKYPYYLKQRILGNRGHLSNDTSADLISKLMNYKLKHILLAHLSKENNYEELAYETVCCELTNRGCDFASLHLSVAHRERPSEMVLL